VGHGGGVVQLTQIADSRAVCARFRGGAVRCWGQNDKGQLGYGHSETLGAKYTPDELQFRPAGERIAGGDVPLPGSTLVLAEGGRCALLVDGALYCWGDNEDGELGLPAEFPAGSKTRTPAEMGAVAWE
jgi:alpha-tubulin suppressor-like RCC1 family protein